MDYKSFFIWLPNCKFGRAEFGALTMADAFIAWGRATDLHYSLNQPYAYSKDWRLSFHLISVLVLLIVWMPVYFKTIKAF